MTRKLTKILTGVALVALALTAVVVAAPTLAEAWAWLAVGVSGLALAAVSGGVQFDQTQGNAAVDLDTKVYTAVKLTTTGVHWTGTGERAIGILQNKPKTGEGCAVRMLGTSKFVVDGAAGAIAAGDKLKSDNAGRGIKTTIDGDELVALALEASTALGDVIEVQIVDRQA